MEMSDLRKLFPAAIDHFLKEAIRLFKKGYTFIAIADAVGANRNTVSSWCGKYAIDGASAMQSRPRGRKKGEKRHLSEEQERDIQHCLIDKTPDQYKLTFALWTRAAVRQLIELRTGIRMPVRTVGLYLSRWGFTPQKPLKRAYEQRQEAVRRWHEEEYPAIVAKAKAENAEINWGDETGIRSDSQHGRSYAPRGQTPASRLSACRTSTNMISTVTNQGKLRFMLFNGGMNAQLLIRFMKRLCRDAGRKVILILDNLKVHHAHIVRDWLEAHSDLIEVFYLPSYSPELNPDEYLNGTLKAIVHSKPPTRTHATLQRQILCGMRSLQKLPQNIARLFNHPKIAYAR